MNKKRLIIISLMFMTMLLGQGAATFSLAEVLHQQGIDSVVTTNTAEQHSEGDCFTADFLLLASSALIFEYNLINPLAFASINSGCSVNEIAAFQSLARISIRAPPIQNLISL
ncbi:hypothetical protein GCM10007916_20900 [Psychromonas marina]|uniref:Uncharacterized protein n=1 Tax=Psychromonas marina TaxID=88364 RepID=A0ABQ6E120_9GAMM|nr:hypothetical protein [Psychromonas marina]GLS91022.1 hypothetical protein GCM10007916_20900 [Psychromonas marina]